MGGEGWSLSKRGENWEKKFIHSPHSQFCRIIIKRFLKCRMHDFVNKDKMKSNGLS